MRHILLLPLLFLSYALAAQTTSQSSFGKNRVQYHRQTDAWVLYETANFITYWYGDARNVAQSALQMAEYDYPIVQQLLEHQTNEKIEMLVFSDISDVRQSNIGEDELFLVRSGETKVVGNKVFVYFDGNHQHLRAQIREGMAGVFINSMLFGSNLQEIVQNAVLLNLPGWYINGLAAYCGDDWNTELDNRLRDILSTGIYKNFDQLAKHHPRLAGHAFWNYVGIHFGKGTVSNLLYLTRINRSMDAGFLYVLGNGYRRTTETVFDYYSRIYREEAKVTRTPDAKGLVSIKNKRNLPLSQVKISPDGRRVAWAAHNNGRWKVYLQELEKNPKRKKILRGGERDLSRGADLIFSPKIKVKDEFAGKNDSDRKKKKNTSVKTTVKSLNSDSETNYPLLCWSPDNQQLVILYEQRDVLKLAFIDAKTGKKQQKDLSPEYQRVYSMDMLSPSELVLSAMVRGYTDLFIYRTVMRQSERLTQDFWDDLNASVVRLEGRRGILFSSNRMADTLAQQRIDTILPIGSFDLFYMDLENRSKELVRVTQTPLANEWGAIGVDSAYFAFLSDENGFVNRKGGYLEPYIAYHQAIFYMKDGAEIKALNTQKTGEWPMEKALFYLAPMDTIRKNIDTTQIDSIRFMPVYKKRPVYWNMSNYDRSIREQHFAPRAGRIIESVPRSNRTIVYARKFSMGKADSTSNSPVPVRLTRFMERSFRDANLPIPVQPSVESFGVEQDAKTEPLPSAQLIPARRDTLTEIPAGWLFQLPDYLIGPAVTTPSSPTRRPNTDNMEPEVEISTGMGLQPDSVPAPQRRILKPQKPLDFFKNNSVIRFNPPQIIPYRLRFRTDYVSTSMDNNLLFEGLESYAGTPQGFRMPPLGILLKANFKDLLEDHIVEMGFRLPTTFNGAEYYIWYANKKRRIDKRAAMYRQSITNSAQNNTLQFRNNTLLGQYELSYPFSPFFSVRAQGTLRQDKTILLSSDRQSLEAPDFAEQRASLRLSAVYDNTVNIDLNIKAGSRAKVWVETVKRFEFNTQPSWSLRLNKGFMTVLGLDARHYQPIDRNSIIAFRLSGATTFGSERVLYYLGGVENWIIPSFNNNIPVPRDGNFAFEALAANLRGFRQNIRNGNSFALLNAELRVPIFKYFSKKPVIGNFWRNFQLIGFFDTGTAWQGRSPYSGENPLNIIYVYNPPTVAVKVNYFRDPLVAGYGVGMRTQLFGMYVRADYGWGIETKVVQKPILHIALGTDF